ncbi:class I SAM-dependent methyltransferase [Natrinema halophilum]|uniref:Class I SAM-dependent methyltransferase n=1 Tax=Natrinema halophilum TaxID=1699371 RepID=A0A7D5GFV3_9EURY|nr:class I SAM-dependent methyltransferase [Natrinema halophilum]QLG47848.1 class I SAM-dependent methyltransferase [Natrinema halophilum]
MQKVYRYNKNESYWEDRWENAGVDKQTFDRLDFYPIKYAKMVIDDLSPSSEILEAGCGPGRLYFHFDERGYDMTGVDFSSTAIDHIREIDPDADVEVADVRDLPFPDESFDAVLAFGLFHNFGDPQDLAAAFSETARVLKPGGRIVLSVRCDSLENHLIEYITAWKSEQRGEKEFHKLHFTRNDVEFYITSTGLTLKDVEFARNVSFLFKFDSLRAPHMRGESFDESVARASGFQLFEIGDAIDTTLHTLFPKQFSNELVAFAQKPETEG